MELLKDSLDGDIQAAGGSLDSLRKLRNKADYEVGLKAKPGGFTKLQAQIAAASSMTIVEAIRKVQGRSRTLHISP